MKRTSYLLILCFIISFGSYSQELVFNAKIKDVDTMMILCRSISGTDTINTTDGHFIFRKKLSFPELYTIVCVRNPQSIAAIREGNERKMASRSDGTSREIFFENGTASISCSFADFGKSDIVRTNSSAQKLYDEFWKRFNPLVKIARTIIDSSYSPGKTESDKKTFTMLHNRVEQVENETAEKFAMENAGNTVGAYVLYRYCHINNANRLDSIYGLFAMQLRKGAYLQNIKEKIKALYTIKPGQPVPDFSAVTAETKKFSFHETKGKYVVLDFWGSWCIPCINGLPKMKEYHARYSQRIAFIGIACNDKTEAWKTAISAYKLPWTHLLDNSVLNLASRFNIEAYPTKILIDKEGNFLQSFKGETSAFYEKIDELMREIK